MDIRKLFLAALAISASALSQEQPAGDLQDVIGTLDVVIGRRGDPNAPPIAMLDVIRAKLTKDRTFSGTLERATFPDGSQFPALVFNGSPLSPDLNAPTSLPVGQYTAGRSASSSSSTAMIPENGSSASGFHPRFVQADSGRSCRSCRRLDGGPEIGDQGDWQREKPRR